MKKILIIFVLAFIGLAADVEGCTIPSCQFFNNGALKNSEMQKEIWKDVIGYEGLYQVSSDGNIKSMSRTVSKKYGNRAVPETMLTQTKRGNYLKVTLFKDNTRHQISVHRLVALTFIKNKHNKPQVNHIDGNKKNNNFLNLEWCTQSENMIHSFNVLKNRPSNGMKGKLGKLNKNTRLILQIDKQTKEIVGNYWGALEAARNTGINNSAISCVCKNMRKTAGGYIWEYAE